jgi:SAM-dependent methyltransferase
MVEGHKLEIEVRNEAERKRSSEEARQRESENLASPRNVTRYMNPQQDTVYALEYAYYLLGNVLDKTVMDLGCGAGENSVLLARRAAKVVGLDISPDLVEIAQRRAKVHGQTVQFIVTSAYATGLPGGSIDVVFGEAILHHLDLERAANEIRRILHPGGYAVFVEPIRDSATLRFLRRLMPSRQAHISPYEYPLTQKKILSFAQGLELSAIRRFDLPFSQLAGRIGWGRDCLGWRHRFALRADQWLLTAVPRIGHFASIVVFQVHAKTFSAKPP